MCLTCVGNQGDVAGAGVLEDPLQGEHIVKLGPEETAFKAVLDVGLCKPTYDNSQIAYQQVCIVIKENKWLETNCLLTLSMLATLIRDKTDMYHRMMDLT